MISDEIETKFKEYVKTAKFSTFDELASQFVEDLTERQLKYLIKKGIEDGWMIPIRRGEYNYKEPIQIEVKQEELKPVEQKVEPVEQKVETKSEVKVETKLEQKEEVILPKEEPKKKEEPEKPKTKKEEVKKEEPDFLTKKRREIEDLQVKRKKLVEEPKKEPETTKVEKEQKKPPKSGFPWIWVAVAIGGIVATILFLKVFIFGKKEPRLEKQPEEEKGVLDQMGVMNAEDLFKGR